jgi:hypothetical protein
MCEKINKYRNLIEWILLLILNYKLKKEPDIFMNYIHYIKI